MVVEVEGRRGGKGGTGGRLLLDSTQPTVRERGETGRVAWASGKTWEGTRVSSGVCGVGVGCGLWVVYCCCLVGRGQASSQQLAG